jgi:hypothetical protein
MAIIDDSKQMVLAPSHQQLIEIALTDGLELKPVINHLWTWILSSPGHQAAHTHRVYNREMQCPYIKERTFGSRKHSQPNKHTTPSEVYHLTL